MSGAEKAGVLTKVASSGLPKRRDLGALGVPRSTYYRWLRRKEGQRLEDNAGGGNPPWNKQASQEVGSILSAAREMPELSCRQLAAWTIDNMGFSVSESTVYRILRREGLVQRPEMRLAAGKGYHPKTTGPHQMWATGASYSLVTVMDDDARFIRASPLHPQTNGKLERYHQTRKREVNHLPYEMSSDLEAAIVAFVSSDNYRRYHKALGNVTPSDVLKGRGQEILRRREGGAGPNNPRAETAQQGPQGAYKTSSPPLISRVSKCPTFAGCQHSGDSRVRASSAKALMVRSG